MRYTCTYCHFRWSGDKRCPLCDCETSPDLYSKNKISGNLLAKLDENIRKIAELTIENEEIIQLLPYDIFQEEKPEMGFSFDDDVEDNVGINYKDKYDCQAERLAAA
jgi:hypothetical protein